jgi:hypothetical protein
LRGQGCAVVHDDTKVKRRALPARRRRIFCISFFFLIMNPHHQIPEMFKSRERGVDVHAREAWDSGHPDLLRVYLEQNRDFRNKLRKLLRRSHRKNEAIGIDGVQLTYHGESKNSKHLVRMRVHDSDLQDEDEPHSLRHFLELMAGIEERVDERLQELKELPDRTYERAEWSK